jgi:alkylresorcinol/alkylpyrone synthase
LLVATEICSATYFPAPQQDLGNSISNLLFNDGSSAMILADSPDHQYPMVLDFERLYSKESKHLLGYVHQDGRMKVQLAREVPQVVPPMVVQTINSLLARNGLTKEDINSWIIHNGGVAILKEIAALMGMDSERDFRYSWEILREYGNLSSATVGLIAEAMHRDPANRRGYVVGCAMGAGAGVGAVLLRYH